MQHNGYRFVMWNLSGSDQSVSCEGKNVKHIKDENVCMLRSHTLQTLKSIGVCKCPILSLFRHIDFVLFGIIFQDCFGYFIFIVRFVCLCMRMSVQSISHALVGVVAGGGRINKPIQKAGHVYLKYKMKRTC